MFFIFVWAHAASYCDFWGNEFAGVVGLEQQKCDTKEIYSKYFGLKDFQDIIFTVVIVDCESENQMKTSSYVA